MDERMILLKLTVTLNALKVIGFIVLIFAYSYLTFCVCLKGRDPTALSVITQCINGLRW